LRTVPSERPSAAPIAAEDWPSPARAQDRALAVGERVGLGPGVHGEARVDRAAAGVHGAHRGDELFDRTIFQQIARDAGVHGAAQIARARERRHDDDPRRARAAAQLRGNVEPGQQRHLDVAQQNVRRELLDAAQRGRTVVRVAHDLDVGFQAQQRGERARDELLVLGDDDADQRAAPGASGSVTTSRVP
jgi:hypothetical protein